METILTLDHQILSFISAHLQTGWMTSFMRLITALGNGGAIWLLIALVLVLRPKTRRWGAMILVAMAAGLVIGEFGLKNLLQRPRPFVRYEDFTALIPPPGSYSFPSGHTTSSFAAATVLFAMKKPVGICALVLAALIAFSRLYLCVHFPTDVLAGLLLGVDLGIVAVFAVRRVADSFHYSKLQ